MTDPTMLAIGCALGALAYHSWQQHHRTTTSMHAASAAKAEVEALRIRSINHESQLYALNQDVEQMYRRAGLKRYADKEMTK